MSTLSAGCTGADFDLRPPVRLAHAGRRPGIDVEDVPGLLGEMADVLQSVPCWPGI